MGEFVLWLIEEPNFWLIVLIATGIFGLLWATVHADQNEVENEYLPGHDDFNMWW